MRYITGLICFSSILLFVSLAFSKNLPTYVGIFYSKPPPEEALYLYDWLIVDPYVFPMKGLREKFYIKKKARLIAYLSIGEMGTHNRYYNHIKKGWVIGQNKMWKSIVLDLRKEGYRKFLLSRILPSIMKKGYEGVMLDTLDSYQAFIKNKKWKEYETAEVSLIKEIKRRYPHLIIVVNRPFRIIDQIKGYVDAFLAESLFYGIDSNLNYTKMKQEHTKRLLAKLNHVKSLGLPVIVVDYVDPRKKDLARKVAERIKKLGFIPWVTDKNLSAVGIGSCELIPRKVLLLYDSRLEPDPALSSIHRLIQMPLEWLGLVPEVYDISKGIPEKGYIGDTYRGMVVWIPELKVSIPFCKWIKRNIKEGLKVFFLDSFGFPVRKDLLRPLQIDVVPNKCKPLEEIKIIKKADILGFNAEPLIEHTDYLLYPRNGIPLIVAENQKGQRFAPLAITPWGGYSIPDSCLIISAKEDIWTVDPMKLFRLVFTPLFPAPDITTENGRRLLTAHIDGDAFFGDTDFDPSKTTGEVIKNDIIMRYKIPHTVSIIEAEVAPWGLYPKKSKRLEKIAKSIFALSNVEAASHTFSHPFFWKKINARKAKEEGYGHNLPVKGYRFNIKREISGSVKYINKALMPKGKKVKVFLWSGDCLPPKEALKITYKIGIYNVNGGDTNITNQSPFISHISPMGINLGEYFQVYAPIINENVYTNLWHGPYYGYINVISTFRLTDKPRRVKPISIYYHFYSGQKLASLRALKKVYNWALSQEVNPVYISEYAQKVLEFRSTAIARDGDLWIVRNGGALRTVRVDKPLFPVLSKSKGVVGYKKINDSLYIHLDGSGDYRIYLGKKEKEFYLYDTNSRVLKYKREKNKVFIQLKGYMPVDFKVVPAGCRLIVKGGEYRKSTVGMDKIHYSFKKATEVSIEALCKD